MDLHPRGRTALVTGASSGIGRAIAYGLALEGVRVVGAGRRTALIEALAAEAAAAGGAPIVSVACDLSVPDAALDLAERATAQLGGQVDILMNVAGASRPVTLQEPASTWANAMGIGFLLHVQLTHALLPGMRSRRWGRVVTVTGSSEPRFLSAATPPKAALHIWSKAVSREVAVDGVTMNCIQPGKIRSDQITRKFPTAAAEQAYALQHIPMNRIGEGDELAAAALFLASARASYITGAVIPVDGGFRHYAF